MLLHPDKILVEHPVFWGALYEPPLGARSMWQSTAELVDASLLLCCFLEPLHKHLQVARVGKEPMSR